MARHSQHRFQWSDFNVEVWLMNLQLLKTVPICHLIGRIVSEQAALFVQLKVPWGKNPDAYSIHLPMKVSQLWSCTAGWDLLFQISQAAQLMLLQMKRN